MIAHPLSSGRQDSNLRPPGPKPGAMTGLRYAPNKNALVYFNRRRTFPVRFWRCKDSQIFHLCNTHLVFTRFSAVIAESASLAFAAFRHETGGHLPSPCFAAVRAGFEPAVQLPVRQFSKLVVSASHPPHQNFMSKELRGKNNNSCGQSKQFPQKNAARAASR
jgi:hypothetical protein